jgi:acyl-CoA thioester hydrolase
MPRPDPWRLDLAAYPYSEAIQTRFADLDVLGHINNVAMAGLFEAGRARFMRATGMFAAREHRMMLVNVELNYLAEGSFPEDVTIGTGVSRIGGRSWTLLAAAFQGGRCIATCDATAASDGPEISPALRTMLERWMISR